MTDYTYETAGYAEAQGRPIASVTHWAGAAVSLALIVGVGVWGYKLLARDVSGVPVVQATQGPMRIAPEDPGGTLADHQGLAVNMVAGIGTTAPPPDQLMLAPQAAGLSAEDVALGDAAVAQPLQTRPASITAAPDLGAGVAPTALSEPAPEVEEEDPILALANKLAAGAVPLSDLAPGDTPDVVTSLSETSPVERPEDLTAAVQPPKPGPGLARSLRPKLRPGGLQTASVAAAAAAAAPAAAAAADTAANGDAVPELEAASLPTGTRLVQIGAFDSPKTARAEWQRLETRFGDYLVGKSRVIQRASSGGRVFYRLRAHGFDDLSDARRFCATFVAAKVDCIPVVTR